jgi:hypothetical protein
MNRRGFLGAILACGAAPAIVRAESLMKIYVPQQKIFLRDLSAYPPFCWVGFDPANGIGDSSTLRIVTMDSKGNRIYSTSEMYATSEHGMKEVSQRIIDNIYWENSYFRMTPAG